MLKNVYLVTSESNRDYYQQKHQNNIDELIEDLRENNCSFELIISPNNIDKKWLSEESAIITDCPKLLSAFAKARGNVLYFHNEANKDISIPWDAGYILESFDSFWYESIIDGYNELNHTCKIILETPRMIIRESTVEDVDEFYRIYNEEGITDYTEALFPNPEDERQYMRDYIREIYGFYGYGIWTLILKESGKVIGRAGYSIREGYSDPELGYVIEKSLQNRGLATEACEAILNHAKNKSGALSMQALTRGENIPSVKLLNKLGFKYEGEIKEKNKIYQLYTIIL